MDVSKLYLSTESLAGKGSKRIYITSCKEVTSYVDGKATDSIENYRIECVFPDNQYEKVIIKVTDKPPVTQEMIDKAESPITVSLQDLECKLYRDFKNNTYSISCKAKALALVK
ncbi:MULTISPECIES: hypothetical protein [unclassified Lacrimispora]|uniref:hypothetical protein n=1 Tax=unclassified Lacrimispora TaxID=2719232 RepID=UPI00376F639E